MRDLREDTVQDIKDSIKMYKLKKQFDRFRETGDPKDRPWRGRGKGIENARLYLTQPRRTARLKRDLEVAKVAAGATAGTVVGGTLALKVLMDRRRKSRWLKNGCDNIESKSEKSLCLNYLERQRLKRER